MALRPTLRANKPRTMSFTAPPGFRNGHISTILGNHGPRKWHVNWLSRPLRQQSQSLILNCREGIQLHGEYTANENPHRGLVILIHGWEGCAHSTYLLSTATQLFNSGFSVFRLNLRDHGPSHHLNAEPFLAIRLDEVLDAIEQVQQQFPHERNYLAGYSLGGNIAVRVAANINTRPIQFNQVAAICPPIDPGQAAQAICTHPLYNRHFVSKWQKSFNKKLKYFPEHQDNADIFSHSDLIDLHEAFVPRYSQHPNASSYFKAYALDKANLPKLDVPCHIIMTADDPVIPIGSTRLLPEQEGLSLEICQHGGHCGFVSSYQLDSWLDKRLEALFH